MANDSSCPSGGASRGHRCAARSRALVGPVRSGGDGNWLVAEAMEYDNQSGLLWGPFFDQGRGEEINSFGWYPNGQSFRQWWAPYAMRELQRTNGIESVVFNLSDWWQYDAGYPDNNYATFEMFNNWLVAHKGQTIAGMKIDGQPIVVSTLTAMEKLIQTQYKGVFAYFVLGGTRAQRGVYRPATGSDLAGLGANGAGRLCEPPARDQKGALPWPLNGRNMKAWAFWMPISLFCGHLSGICPGNRHVPRVGRP